MHTRCLHVHAWRIVTLYWWSCADEDERYICIYAILLIAGTFWYVNMRAFVLCLSHVGQLRADETLFAYPSGQTYLNYSYPDHVPRYSDEIDPALFVNFTTGCNNNSICLYDALESGDITLGQMSQSTTNSLSASESTARKFFP